MAPRQMEPTPQTGFTLSHQAILIAAMEQQSMGIYLYLITDSFPYISRCLNGKIPAELSRRPRGRTNNRPPPPKS